MTDRIDHTDRPIATLERSEPAPPADRPAAATWTLRHASLTAGVGLLLMAALAGFGYGVVVLGSVTPGDAARTAADIAATEGRFRAGIVALSLVVVLDVVVAWALYRFFAPVHRGLSQLAAWSRLVYAAVFLVAIGHLVAALRYVGDDHLAAFGREQLDAHLLLSIGTFEDVWNLGLLLFGFHLVVLAVLAYRSGYVPRVLGGLLAIAGVGYLYDSAATVMTAGAAAEVSTVTFVGEVLLALWLLVRGRQLPDDAGPLRVTRSR